MFETILVKPIINLLIIIYSLIPTHNFGLAIILFTLCIRILLWPLVKKQLHHAKAMQRLQPEIRRIKKETKGDRVREQKLLQELYREKEINPLGAIGIMIIQLPILFALFSGLNRIINDPSKILDLSYSWVDKLPFMKDLASNIDLFKDHNNLFGIVDLSRKAYDNGNYYWWGMLLVLVSAVMQYFTAKQLMPNNTTKKSLRQLFREAGEGKEADKDEARDAVMGINKYIIPFIVFFVSIRFVTSLALYWAVSSILAYIQQGYILKKDAVEMDTSVNGEEVKAEITKPEPQVSSIKKTPKKKNKSKSSRKKVNKAKG